jgi:integrase
VERSTGCRDETAARQKLAGWEREAEQVRAGVLDAGDLETAKAGSGDIQPHVDAYGRSLGAAAVSESYRANALRAVRRLVAELGVGTVRDLRRDKFERWLGEAVAAGMGARTRNYYRDAVVRFANWLRDSGRLAAHDLHRLPKADERADPKRKRRAMTEDEFARLLAAAARRPLDDARTIRRGADRGRTIAAVTDAEAGRLAALGRERVLIYRTFVTTGLRLNELRTLTVAQLDLTPGRETLQLDSADEKNRSGSTVPLRADLSQDLRGWIADNGLTAADLLFTVPAGLRRILDRDLRAAGIAKRDERGRTVDVHALRTTFGTWLSMAEVAPRTAQAAMRHGDISLTMGTYTDPKLLDVRRAIEQLAGHAAVKPPTKPSRPGDALGHSGAPSDANVAANRLNKTGRVTAETPQNSNEKAPVTSRDITGAESGYPDLNRRPLAPKASALPN